MEKYIFKTILEGYSPSNIFNLGERRKLIFKVVDCHKNRNSTCKITGG